MKITRLQLVFIVVGALILIVGGFLFFARPGGEQHDVGSRGVLGGLFPFNFGGGGPVQDAGSGGGVDTGDLREVPALRQVSEKPTAGGFVFGDSAGSTTVRFIERETGHVFETPSDSFATTRISNTTIPGIQEVLWEDGDRFIIRYLEDDAVRNFYVRLKEGETEQALSGSFLKNWDRAAFDPQRKTLFAISETESGSVGVLSNPDGKNGRTVFSSSLRSWIPLQSKDALFVESAPTPFAPGFLYEVRGSSLIRVLGDILGLESIVSSSGRFVLYSESTKEGSKLSLLDRKTGEVSESPLGTLATKCVFVSEETPLRVFCGVPESIPRGAYPTDWYLGRVHFSDDLWLLEPTEGTATLLAVPGDDVGATIDVWQPVVNGAGSHVGFINKNDLSYWLLKIED